MGNEQSDVNKHKQGQRCSIDLECQGCPYVRPDDIKNIAAGLGFRFILSLITVLVLGVGIRYNVQGFMFSACIYTAPLLRDYIGFKPKQKKRKIIRHIQIGLLSIMLLACSCYLFHVFSHTVIESGEIMIILNPIWVYNANRGVYLRHFWLALFVIALMTGLDYFIYKPTVKAEVTENENVIAR